MLYFFLICSLGWSLSCRSPKEEYAKKVDTEITVSYKNPYLFVQFLGEQENDSIYWGQKCNFKYKYKIVEILTETYTKTAKGINYQSTQLGGCCDRLCVSGVKLASGVELYSEDIYKTIRYSPFVRISCNDIKVFWSLNKRGMEGKIPFMSAVLMFKYFKSEKNEDWQIKVSSE